MLTDRPRAAGELVRVCRRGGFVLANEFVWRRVPSDSARQQLREMTPGLQVDPVDGWVEIYRAAGLVDVRTVSGPFGMLTPRGFVVDEGFRRILVIFGRASSRIAYLRRMAWLMPRFLRAAPYLGYVVIVGRRP